MEDHGFEADENIEVVAHLQLTKPAQFSEGKPQDYQYKTHPEYCSRCLNLDPVVIHHVHSIAEREFVTYGGPFEGVASAWRIYTTVGGVHDGAAEECSSCVLLKSAILAFGGFANAQDVRDLLLTMYIQVGRVLRITWDMEGGKGDACMLFVESGRRVL
jgi:hypothetical protein